MTATVERSNGTKARARVSRANPGPRAGHSEHKTRVGVGARVEVCTEELGEGRGGIIVEANEWGCWVRLDKRTHLNGEDREVVSAAWRDVLAEIEGPARSLADHGDELDALRDMFDVPIPESQNLMHCTSIRDAAETALRDAAEHWLQDADLATLATVAKLARESVRRRIREDEEAERIALPAMRPGLRVQAIITGIGVHGSIISATEHGAFIRLDKEYRNDPDYCDNVSADGIIGVVREKLSILCEQEPEPDEGAGTPTADDSATHRPTAQTVDAALVTPDGTVRMAPGLRVEAMIEGDSKYGTVVDARPHGAFILIDEDDRKGIDHGLSDEGVIGVPYDNLKALIEKPAARPAEGGAR